MHTHKWSWLSAYSKEQKAHISGIMCLCGEQMSLEEAERRLNAAEMLSANNAMKVCQFISQHEVPETGEWNAESRLVDALSEYAHVLEGERHERT